jgi:hypothetical protein
MKNAKRNYYKDTKALFENFSLLYDAFNNNPISYKEYEIWEYIKNMELDEMSEMFYVIISKLDRLDLSETYFNPVLFQFMVCQYVQELRLNEGLI